MRNNRSLSLSPFSPLRSFKPFAVAGAQKESRPAAAIFVCFLLIFVFAFLIGDTATRFTSGLAGRLAFAAAAVFRAFAKIFGCQSFNGFHIFILRLFSVCHNDSIFKKISQGHFGGAEKIFSRRTLLFRPISALFFFPLFRRAAAETATAVILSV